MDMVRSMRSNTKLPQYLWTETLKTAVYILNRVPTKAISKTPFKSFKGWKPSLRHIRIWGCPSEVRIYNPQEKKLNLRTISGYFIGYVERSKGYRFYFPSHSTRIVESRNAKFLENDLISGSDQFQDIVSEKDHYESQSSSSSDILIVIHTPQVQPSVRQPFPKVPHIADIDVVDQVVNEEIPEIVEQPIEQQVDQQIPQENDEAILRRSTRVRKSVIPNNYIVYLQELDYNIGVENDPEAFSQAMSSKESNSWYRAMKEEMNSMASNRVWDLVELPDGIKAIGCKWVFKTKDSLGNIERHKAKLVAKGFNQRERIDYTETFSPVSKKDSLWIIMALVAYFDFDLHPMDVKTTFLNGNLEGEVYMK